MKKYNVVYLHCHDMGRYLQPYGYGVPSPNLQAFAERSTVFRQAHSAAPNCSPSRSALLTGTHPHECMLGLAHQGFPLIKPERHLANFLKGQGYNTALSGVQHEGKVVNDCYDRILCKPEYHKSGVDQGRFFLKKDREAGKAAAEFIRGNHESPFFLSCGFILPHRKFPRKTPFKSNTVRPPEPLVDRQDIREDWSRYMAAVQGMDEAAGLVLDAINDSGREKDTIVLFTSDHGPSFPEMKGQLTDFGTQVAMMIQYPGNKTKGKALDNLVSQLDVYPTLCDLLGLKKPDYLRGHSLLNLLEGQRSTRPSEVFSELTYHAAYEPMRAIRTERYKFIRSFSEDKKPVPANCDTSVAKKFWYKTAGMLKDKSPEIFLYDLYRDPLERNNVAGQDRYWKELRNLEERLRTHLLETGDPILQGKIELPKGAWCTDKKKYTASLIKPLKKGQRLKKARE